MCKKEYAKTLLAKQKHAEFMLKLAEKIYGVAEPTKLSSEVSAK